MKCKYCYAELKQGAKFCPFCGKKVLEQEKCVKCGEQIKAGALFCPYCGSKQRVEEKVEPVVVEELIPTDKKCIYCGEDIEADSMFCPFCGKSQEVDEVKAEEPQQEPSQDISEQDSSKEDIQPIEEHVYENEEEEGKSMSWLWVLVVLLIAGGIGAWYYLSGGFPLGGSNQMAETADTFSVEIDDSLTTEDNSKPIAFSVIPIKCNKLSDEIETTVSFDFPQTDNVKLRDNIVKLILAALTDDFTWGENPRPSYKGSIKDGKAIAEFFANEKVKEISEEWDKDSMPYNVPAWTENISIRLISENSRYVSYEVNFGGNHEIGRAHV